MIRRRKQYSFGGYLLAAVPILVLVAAVVLAVVLILIVVLAVVLVLILLILVLVLVLIVIHSSSLQFVLRGCAAVIACPVFQDLSFARKIMLANNPAMIAVVMPPAVAFRPPVSAPKKPS